MQHAARTDWFGARSTPSRGGRRSASFPSRRGISVAPTPTSSSASSTMHWRRWRGEPDDQARIAAPAWWGEAARAETAAALVRRAHPRMAPDQRGDAAADGDVGDRARRERGADRRGDVARSEENTSELKSLMRISYAV